MYVYLLVGVDMCECVFFVFVYVLCLFVCLLTSMYVSQLKRLWKVNEIGVCIFSFRLLPLGLALLLR